MSQCPGAHCSAVSKKVNEICRSDGFKGTAVYLEYQGQYCYCNCSCTAVDTLVATSVSQWRRMGDIVVGDTILALNSSEKWEEREVRFSSGTGEGDGKPVPYTIFLSLENGVQLIVTADHPFLLANRKLQVACRLSPNDKLLDENINPLAIVSIGYGEYVGGIHNISTSIGEPGETLDGHLINTGGVISGDFYAQLYLVDDGELAQPQIGMPEYFRKYGITEAQLSSMLQSVNPPDPRFVPHKSFEPPRRSVRFLPDWMEHTLPDNLRPLDDTIPLEIAEYLITHFKKSFPSINYHVYWTDNTVNAYAWIQGGQRHVAVLGGLIRHRAIGIEGLGLVIAHEIGHHYGGAPKYPNNPWASCEGQSDYWGALVAMREVWWGTEAMKQIEAGAEQLYQLFSFGLLSSLSEQEISDRLAGMTGCSHPPADCRRSTYLAALRLGDKPSCAS